MNLAASLAKPIDRIKQKLNDGFIRNLGWLGAAEIINRVFRLVTTVVLARFLTAYDYGLAALVLTTYEFTQAFARIGIGGKVIQADEESLESICNGAYWLNWVVCLGLFIIQCIAAFPVAWFYNDNQLIMPICLLSTIYLVTPIGRIQTALIQRENRLKITAVSSSIQLAVGNILTAVFAALGMGMWAIILPRILVAPLDALISLAYHSWRPKKGFTTERWREIFTFGISILGTSLLGTLRNNLDYLIVGRFVGVKALGVYYFAFNAGLGISFSIIQSITVALYPHLCAARSDLAKFQQCYLKSLKTIATIIIPFVLLQSSLAPLYVPIIFGRQEWVAAIPILILICLSAIPRPFGIASSYLLLAMGKPNLALKWDIWFTVIFAGGLVLGAQWQPGNLETLGVAIAVLVTHLIFIPVFTLWSTRYVFGANKSLRAV
ncbi:MAG TPA: lipopolysaccharide biosynthesis protein [Leptolyngbyaceae cyanobacterium]